MFLPLILLPALVSSEGILDSLLRPLMTQLDGMASHLSSPAQQLHDKGIPERRAPVPRPSSNIKTTINPSPFETRKYERIHQLLHSIQNTVNTILENQESSVIFTEEN